MKVVSAHKGVRSFIVEVIGREAHSSLPDQGVSAAMEAREADGLWSPRWAAKRVRRRMRTSVRRGRQ